MEKTDRRKFRLRQRYQHPLSFGSEQVRLDFRRQPRVISEKKLPRGVLEDPRFLRVHAHISKVEQEYWVDVRRPDR